MIAHNCGFIFSSNTLAHLVASKPIANFFKATIISVAKLYDQYYEYCTSYNIRYEYEIISSVQTSIKFSIAILNSFTMIQPTKKQMTFYVGQSIMVLQNVRVERAQQTVYKKSP